MSQWQPQIRTNLDDAVYVQQLDELLCHVPGSIRAALINTRFQEACVRDPDAGGGGRPAGESEYEALLALTTGLFGEDTPAPPEFGRAFSALGSVDSAHLCFREETLLLCQLPGEQALVLTTSASLNQGACATLLHSLRERLAAAGERQLSATLDPSGEVLAGALIDLRAGTVVERHARYHDASVLAIDDRLARLIGQLLADSDRPPALRLHYRNGDRIEIKRAEIITQIRSIHFTRMQFDPEHILVLNVDRSALRGLVWVMIRRSEIEVVRLWVDGLLKYGIPSTMSPFPATQGEFLEIVNKLRELHENDLLGRLDIGGFANYTVGQGEEQQRCQECIYYLPNGKWCDLPELPVPVEPHWWCRLWKI